MARTGQAAAGIFLVAMIVVAVAVVTWAFAHISASPLDVKMVYDSDNIRSSSSTRLQVTITNTGDAPIAGDVSVAATSGQQYVVVSTQEDQHITLAAKGSSTTKIYQVTGKTDVTVQPSIAVTIKDTSGTLVGSAERDLTVSRRT